MDAVQLPSYFIPSTRQRVVSIHAAFCSGSSSDEQIVDKSLKELDYVPLAIHLLAQVSLDLTPEFTLKQWQKKKTQMLESVEVSIALSITSLDIIKHPGTIQLLGMLCLLPDGLLQWQG